MSKELIYEKQLAYIHGRIECEIEFFAQSIGRPKQDVTNRLATLLLGVGSGLEDSVSSLSADAAGNNKAARKMEVVKRASGRKASANAPRKVKSTYWSSMTPEERSKEVRRRMKVSKKKRLQKAA